MGIASLWSSSFAWWISTLYTSIWVGPYFVTFFLLWIVASLWNPLWYLTILLAVVVHPYSAWRKLELLCNTILYLLFCQDKRWKRPPVDPATYFAAAGAAAESRNDKRRIEQKTIIFIRHGESTWNDTFNKGSHRKLPAFVLGFVPNLIKAVWMEWYFFVTGQATESWFYDAPLSSPNGVTQAETVRQYLEKSRVELEFLPPKEKELLTILLGLEGGGGGGGSNENDCDSTIQVDPLEERSAPAAAAVATETTTTTATTKDDPNGNGMSGSALSLPALGHKNTNHNDNTTAKNKKRGGCSQLVSSNLRRCVSTMAIAFLDRLKQTTNNDDDDGDNDDNDDILLLPELQEISFNPDALCITPAHQIPTPSFTDPRTIYPLYNNNNHSNNNNHRSKFNVQYHTGNKKLWNTTSPPANNTPTTTSTTASTTTTTTNATGGLQRLQAFCSLVFDRTIIPEYKTHIICAGHSLWLRSLFQTYLPYSCEHVAKKKKLVNCGMVAFTLQRIAVPKPNETNSTTTYQYMIDPASIVVLHGGF